MFGWRKRLDLGIVVFELTDACNQRCRFCYNHFKGCGEEHAVASPDFGVARRTLKRLLRQANISNLSLSGGEPMLMPRIHDLILAARFGGANVNLLTNGTLVKEDDVAIMRQLGVGLVQIPLLSHDASRHDHLTQLEGSWARAMESARRIAAVDASWLVPVFILSRLNMGDIEPTLEMYAELGVKRIMLNRFNIGGLGRRYAKELVMTHDELRAAFCHADAVLARLGMRAHNGVCTPMCVLKPEDYPHITFSHCTTELVSRPLTINYRGDVRFCNHSPRVLGNIHDQRLEDILCRTQEEGIYGSTPTRCVGCELWQRCRGGCRAASEQMYGTFDRVDPIISD
ncbi:MAG: radical SAM protein [Alistipes sp.]|nr:radical SAM protein [Alistipes sp.]